MALYEDFSNYSYAGRKEKNTVNIGWIEGEKKFDKGAVTKEFLINLWEYIKFPVHVTRGLYKNKELDKVNDAFIACYNGYEISLGGAEIRVLDNVNKIIYAAPNLILHYIVNHNYLPPELFVEAVINGPKPNSSEYCQYIHSIYIHSMSEYSSKLICPYCNRNKNYFAPSIKKDYITDSEIKVLKSSDLKKQNLKYSDYVLRVICENCGRIFELNMKKLLKNKII